MPYFSKRPKAAPQRAPSGSSASKLTYKNFYAHLHGNHITSAPCDDTSEVDGHRACAWLTREHGFRCSAASLDSRSGAQLHITVSWESNETSVIEYLPHLEGRTEGNHSVAQVAQVEIYINCYAAMARTPGPMPGSRHCSSQRWRAPRRSIRAARGWQW